MKASEVLRMLQEIIDLYDDWYVDIRIEDTEDIDVGSVYVDCDAERIVISDFFSRR